MGTELGGAVYATYTPVHKMLQSLWHYPREPAKLAAALGQGGDVLRLECREAGGLGPQLGAYVTPAGPAQRDGEDNLSPTRGP